MLREKWQFPRTATSTLMLVCLAILSSDQHVQAGIAEHQQPHTSLDDASLDAPESLTPTESPSGRTIDPTSIKSNAATGGSTEMANEQPSDEARNSLSRPYARETCRLDRGCERRDHLNLTYLSYCSRYKVDTLLSSDILMSIMHESSEDCEKLLMGFIQLDELINQFDQLFERLLSRYSNCHDGYSVKWGCEDCRKAYKDWLCAINLPYYMNGERIKPCMSFCERVEQRCPYLHPITGEQYGGQPVFICKDPNIPFVPKITPDIPYSEPTKCYDLCHISENVTELIDDSLSRYKFDKCPDKNSIAEEVRLDPYLCNSDGLPKRQENGNTNKTIHVYMKKINELRQVLDVYANQPKHHKYEH